MENHRLIRSRMIRRAWHALEERDLEKAENLGSKVLRHRPNDVAALHLLGKLNLERGHLDCALHFIRAALKVTDECSDLFSDLGLIFLTMARIDEALSAYDRARQIAPNDPDIWNGRGVALLELDRAEEAISSFDQALAIDPDHLEALGNRGNSQLRLNHVQEAAASYEAALKKAPENARLLTNYAVALRKLDRPDEALLNLAKARVSDPSFAVAQYVQSLVKLSLGDFKAGWRAHEARWATEALAAQRRHFAQPLWLGEVSLAGKTILLHAEQGYGDVIQFVRYVSCVAALRAKIILEVQPELVRLFSAMEGVQTIVPRGGILPPFDFHCPMMSLPLAFGTELHSIPAVVPYLAAPAELAADWRQSLPHSGPLIGLAWAGDRSHKNDLNRSLRLETLRPLFELPNVQFVSLQQEVHEEDAEFIRSAPQIVRFDRRFHDFADTAAVIAHLDLVISVDTAVAHLAGAMAKPLLLLLPYAADFRWLRERCDSPWYPTARLFRQRKFNDWSEVVTELVNELICTRSAIQSLTRRPNLPPFVRSTSSLRLNSA